MNYERKEKYVQAIQLIEPVFNACGGVLAEKGDWLVIENGKQYYMTNKEFTKEFKPKEEPCNQPIIIWRDYPGWPNPYWGPTYNDGTNDIKPAEYTSWNSTGSTSNCLYVNSK